MLDGENLVYSAPTSGGKTLVAEFLMCRTLHRWRKKVLMVLPYVAMVEENAGRLSSLFHSMHGTTGGKFGGKRRLCVEGSHGGRSRGPVRCSMKNEKERRRKKERSKNIRK